MPNILTEKVGPLPGWGWGVAGIGGAYLIVRWRAKKAAASGADSGDSGAGDAGAGSPGIDSSGSAYTGGGGADGSGSYGLGSDGEDFSAIIQRLDALAAAGQAAGGTSASPTTSTSPGNLAARPGYIVIYDPKLGVWRYSKVAVPPPKAGYYLSWDGHKYVYKKGVRPATPAPVATGGANLIYTGGSVLPSLPSPIKTTAPAGSRQATDVSVGV